MDYKKYSGLAKLTKRLNKNCFYNVIYSTRQNEERQLKIEKINTDLKLVESHFIQFSDFKDLENKLSSIIQ